MTAQQALQSSTDLARCSIGLWSSLIAAAGGKARLEDTAQFPSCRQYNLPVLLQLLQKNCRHDGEMLQHLPHCGMLCVRLQFVVAHYQQDS